MCIRKEQFFRPILLRNESGFQSSLPLQFQQQTGVVESLVKILQLFHVIRNSKNKKENNFHKKTRSVLFNVNDIPFLSALVVIHQTQYLGLEKHGML